MTEPADTSPVATAPVLTTTVSNVVQATTWTENLPSHQIRDYVTYRELAPLSEEALHKIYENPLVQVKCTCTSEGG